MEGRQVSGLKGACGHMASLAFWFQHRPRMPAKCYYLNMEQRPTNIPERSPEKILSSEEVLQALSLYAEGYTLGRELSDEKGVYLREVEVKGEREGEMTEYLYMRKGSYGMNQSDVTAISVTYYQDGMPVGGERVAVFNEETSEWVQK